MKQEMDNSKMHGGENLTYMSVSISLNFITDRHGMKRYQRKCLKSPIYKIKNTHKEFNKSNIETYDKKKELMDTNLQKKKP
jgi:hypothetical protein